MTQKYINSIAYKIVGCAIEVHKQLGPGLLESVYEACMIEEMRENNLHVNSQLSIPVHYKGIDLGVHLKIDYL